VAQRGSRRSWRYNAFRRVLGRRQDLAEVGVAERYARPTPDTEGYVERFHQFCFTIRIGVIKGDNRSDSSASFGSVPAARMGRGQTQKAWAQRGTTKYVLRNLPEIARSEPEPFIGFRIICPCVQTRSIGSCRFDSLAPGACIVGRKSGAPASVFS
jgi:hypothetical protein